MNWKAEAMEKLRRYDAMRQAQENIPEEIARLAAEASGLRGTKMDDAPVVEGGNRREDLLLSNLVHRQELEYALQQAQCWLRAVNRALAALTPEEKLVLHRFYIYPERGSVDRLCGELGVEQSSVYRKRDKALRKFTIALYGTADA